MAEDFERMFERKIKMAPHIFKQAFQKAGLQFIGLIQERWYTGRNEDDTGLYIHSGSGRASWQAKTEVANNDVMTRIGTSSKYLKDHEFGKGDYKGVVARPPKKPKAKKPITVELKHIPVRTFVRKDFSSAKIGKKVFYDATKEALKKVVKV